MAIGEGPGQQVYVSDDWNPGLISIFDQDGTLDSTLYESDDLCTVTGIAFDSSGDPYFANNYWENESRRRDYSDEATYERVWEYDGESSMPFGDASDPSAPGWVDQPEGVAVDSTATSTSAATRNGVGALKEFDSEGNYLATIPRDGTGGTWKPLGLPVLSHRFRRRRVRTGHVWGWGRRSRSRVRLQRRPVRPSTPAPTCDGLAVGADGNVYVGDAGNNVIRVFAPVEEDTTAPTCEFSFDGTAGDNGWYTSTGDAVISATDNEGGSGVASIHCAVDGIEQPEADIVPPVDGPVSAGFAITAEGAHTVTYWADDAAGNESSDLTADVWIDTIPPAGTFTINGGAATTHSTSVIGDSAVTDANSVQMRLSVDGGESWTSWLTYLASEPLTLPAGDGSKTVEAEYRDPAGNILDLSASIVLDTTTPPDVTAPTVTIDSPLAGATYPSYPALQPLTLNFSVDDEAGGSAQSSACGTLPSPGRTGTAQRCL